MDGMSPGGADFLRHIASHAKGCGFVEQAARAIATQQAGHAHLEVGPHSL